MSTNKMIFSKKTQNNASILVRNDERQKAIIYPSVGFAIIGVEQIRQIGRIIINECIELTLDTMEIVHKELSYKIIGLAMEVHNRLGHGFLEKVYENALMVLLRREGIDARQQHSIKVYFENEILGEYVAYILIYERIILEIKALDCISDVHRAQALNYLRATELPLAIILNFGKKKLQYERLVL